MSQPASTKPYLIRALFDWCVDSGFTPYVVVSVDEHTRVPMGYVRDGQIVLNIAPYATHQLVISNEDITCQARFGGVAQALYVPIANVAAIYARENGQGMAFELGQQSGAAVELGGVGGEAEEDIYDDEEIEAATEMPVAEAPVGGASPKTEPAEPEPNSRSRSHLRVIK